MDAAPATAAGDMSIVSLQQITWMFLMRKRNLFSRLAIAAVVAGSITMAGQTQADYDFDALLADVDFGQAAADVEEAVTPSASDAVGIAAEPLPAQPLTDATELIATPATQAVEVPQEEAAQPLPAPPVSEDVAAQPIPEPVPAGSAAENCGQCASASCGQCGQQCGAKCGKLCKLGERQWYHEGFCQPYTPPQLPTSTFYQYWRSSPCNVNVWNGFKNRCHPHIDLSLHGNKSCGNHGGCASGGCYNIQPAGCGDCGPMPAEWGAKSACDACDAK